MVWWDISQEWQVVRGQGCRGVAWLQQPWNLVTGAVATCQGPRGCGWEQAGGRQTRGVGSPLRDHRSWNGKGQWWGGGGLDQQNHY